MEPDQIQNAIINRQILLWDRAWRVVRVILAPVVLGLLIFTLTRNNANLNSRLDRADEANVAQRAVINQQSQEIHTLVVNSTSGDAFICVMRDLFVNSPATVPQATIQQLNSLRLDCPPGT